MAKEDEQKEEKLIPVGEGADPVVEKPVEPEKPVETAEVEEEDDERIGHSEEDEVDPERQALRERRREERRTKRNRDRTEMNFLRKRNEQLERQVSAVALRQTQHERISVNQRLGEVDGKLREVDSIYDKAIINKDEETAAEARRVRADLEGVRDKLREAASESERTERVEAARATEPDTPPEKQRAMDRAREWVGRNSWYDPKLGDERSHFAKVIEDRLSAEGELTADDPEYWRELDRRIAKHFPDIAKKKPVKTEADDLFDEDDEDEGDERPARKPAEPPKRKSGGPKFSVGGKTRALKPNEVYLSKERRAALEEMGVMDDPILRDKYFKAYQRYDEEEARKNS